MRLLGWAVVGLVLAFPALAPAQAVKQKDIIGTWVGNVEYTSNERRNHPFQIPMKTTVRATYYPDGLFRFVDESGTHGAGRWRLSGDTLWWGTDARYGNEMIYTRGELPEGPVTDTTQWKIFPANDSLFWTAPRAARGGGYWHLTAYKISGKGDRLTLARITALSNNEWDLPGGVFERKK